VVLQRTVMELCGQPCIDLEDAAPDKQQILCSRSFGQAIYTEHELAEAVSQAVGYQGNIDFDISKPDGTPRKLMDSGRLRALGWQPSVELMAGLNATYRDFLNNSTMLRAQ